MVSHLKKISQVAKEVISYCTSCRIDLNHVIVAMKGEAIAKVQCLTCKKEHTYRAPKGVKTPLDPSIKKAKSEEKKPKAQPIELEWERLMHLHRGNPIQPYSIKKQFHIGDRISHPNFGDGIIGKIIYPNKIEVIFRDDVKVLIHSGSPA